MLRSAMGLQCDAKLRGLKARPGHSCSGQKKAS